MKEIEKCKFVKTLQVFWERLVSMLNREIEEQNDEFLTIT